MSDYSHELENVIRETLDSEEINYDFDNDKGYFRFGIALPGKIKRVDVIIDIKMDKFVTYVICPLYADFENEEKKLKFLKLMGGFKNVSPSFSRPSPTVARPNMALSKKPRPAPRLCFQLRARS